jgi:hypothetical protein
MDAELRALVWQRAGDRCEYCRLRQDHLPLTLQIEHIIAKQHGGDDEPHNLALSCDRCNAYKGPNLSGIDPDTRQVVSLFNPRTQNWHEHFSLDGATIVGLTPIGRATLRVLNMNAPRRVRLRAALLVQGELSP